MTSIHPSPPNLVPTISSGALPQTPASEWAENASDVLGGHVTRTPVGTPGPDVPGGFPAHLEPDLEPGVEQAPQDTLLATAQSYMPSLATAKAYLPQAVASYLPSSESERTLAPSASESSLPPLPPSSASLSSGLPQDDTPVDVRHESYRTTSSAGDTLSMTAHTGHSSAAIAPPSPSTARPRATSGLLPSHPGVARESSVATLDSDAAADADVDLNTPQLVQSSIPLAPGESTDLALPAESSSSVPSSLTASASAPQEHPRPTSGLLPSHPGAVAEPLSHVNAVPTQALEGVHPTPHAAPASSTSLASSPSLVPPSLRGGESGYAASSESIPTPGSAFTPTPRDGGGEGYAGVGAHGSAALNSSRFEDNVPTGDLHHPQSRDVPAPTGDFTPRVEGSAALNSSRVEDNVPTGDFTPRIEGSAALNSSRFEDNVPTGDLAAPSSGLDAGVQSEEGQEADDEASSGAGEGEGDVDVDQEGDAGREEEGEGTKKSKKTKKPKLMQRLKERMHVGGGGGGTA